MPETTKFLHTHICDMCGYVIAEDIQGALDPELAVKFTVQAPGVQQRNHAYPNARTVLVCKLCSTRNSIAEFAAWLERTKD